MTGKEYPVKICISFNNPGICIGSKCMVKWVVFLNASMKTLTKLVLEREPSE